MMTFKRFGLTILLSLIHLTVFSDTPADEREAYGRDEINLMDNGDLCPRTSNKKYHHHFILVDSTAPLRPSQVELVKRLVLPEQYLETLAPWDRLSIMNLRSVKPAKNKPLFSKCRPRSGNPGSIYKIDKHDWKFESESDLRSVYDTLFVGEISAAIGKIANPESSDEQDDRLLNSPIMSQIKEISRMLDLEFTPKSGYESRKLTIVSDLAQNTSRISFYDECPGAQVCPSWQEFKNDKKYKRWVKRLLPQFGDGVEVELVYLNSFIDPNLDKGILDFWYDFFEDVGVTKINDRIESDEV